MQSEFGSRLLAGKYRLLRPLGQGGMGTVWLAEHLSLRSSVAVKLLEPHIAEDPQSIQRFLNEARAAAALRSPNVVQILDHGVDDRTPFIVMELLEGECLSERLHRVKTLSPAETARIVSHVARALSRAHEAGIVHRDLKPGNVFIVHDDDEEIAKLFDFGIAKNRGHHLSMRADATTVPGTLVGTPYYMSPEQAQGEKTDHRSDIWALGVIAFECLLGRRPFEAEALGSLLLRICSDPLPVPSNVGPVPEAFDAWFAKACARDIHQRFSSARHAAAELRVACRIEHRSPDSPTPVSLAERPRAIASWVPAALLTAIVLGGAGVWALATLRSRDEPTSPTAAEVPLERAPVPPGPPASAAAAVEVVPVAPSLASAAEAARSQSSSAPPPPSAMPTAPSRAPTPSRAAPKLVREPMPAPERRPPPSEDPEPLPQPPAHAVPPPGGVDLGI